MTFNTGNNVPSTDPRDLYDNAENLDKLVNGADPFYADRLGKLRESWAGMESSFTNAQEGRENTFTLSQADKESRFQAFLESSGYIDIGPYAAGVEFTARNQYVAVDGQFYRPAAGTALPYTATGDWATESGSFVLLGDDVLRQELASAAGASLVRYGTRTVAEILESDKTVRPRSYGAVADGVTDDTVAIQAALDAGLYVDFGDASNHYLVNGKLQLRSGHYLAGRRAVIRQSAVQTTLFDADGLSDVTVTGLELIGADEATYVNSPTSHAIGVSGSEAVNLQIIGNVFRDFRYSSVMTNLPVDGATFAYNVVHGPGAAVLNDPNYRNTTGFTLVGKNINVFGNRISGTASGGIIGQLSENVTVTGNVIHDIVTEHGLYCDTGIFGLSITGNTIRNTVASGLKVQNYDAGGGNSGSVSITGNTISGVSGGDGIQVINTGPTATPMRCKVLTITGNTIANVGQDGIAVRYADDANVTGNSVAVVGRAGLYFDQYSNLVATGNNIRQTQWQGIFDANGVGAKISNNKLEDVGRVGGIGAGLGIHITAGSEKEITGNTIRGNATLMEHGIFIEAGTQSTMSVSGNVIAGFRVAAMRFKNPAEPLRYYADNQFVGGVLYLYETLQAGNFGKEWFGTAIPTTGTWNSGDRVVNRYPSAGQYSGWVCVVAGSPGSWKGYGLIQA